jgi:hypothetical protein
LSSFDLVLIGQQCCIFELVEFDIRGLRIATGLAGLYIPRVLCSAVGAAPMEFDISHYFLCHTAYLQNGERTYRNNNALNASQFDYS